jgi:hypothetical protein
MTGDRCENWADAPGYGNRWNQFLVLDPDLYSTTEARNVNTGESIYIDCYVRYDLECDYDYAYIKWSDDGGTTWTTMARFNGAAGNPPNPPSYPACGDDYYGTSNFNQGVPGSISWLHFPTTEADAEMVVGAGGHADMLIGFNFYSDGAWSDKDGDNTDGAYYVDEIDIYWYDTTKAKETLEFENADLDHEPSKWTIIPAEGRCDMWWMAHDPDPPWEPIEGATICEENASWVWTACPYQSALWRVPASCNGFYVRLASPRIYTGWANVPPFNIAKSSAGLAVQFDTFVCFKEQTCDYYDTKINVYNTNPVSGNPGWCGWENIDGYIYYGGCDFMSIDRQEDVSQFMGAAVDSVWYAWDMLDVGATDDFCWTTTKPQPHRLSMLMVDNISFGIFDGAATFFHARVIDLFQDTFELTTLAHNALCANGDMPKTLDWSESLVVDIHDLDGLETSGHVKLVFTDDDANFGTPVWSSVDMVLKFPDPSNPNLGGTYIGSVSPTQVYGSGTEWVPGTVVWYYIEAKDDNGNYAYWPSTAAPPVTQPTRPWFANYFEFSILPGTGEVYPEEPNRLLLVDDFGRSDYDYHPDMAESTVLGTENFYEGLLYDLGYCYDKYDVQGASTGLSNECWDILAPDPAEPDSIIRNYDAVIWFTSRFDEYTVLDTMQCRLRDFVLRGGDLFICGNEIGSDMAGADPADTCFFYESLLGAALRDPDASTLGIAQPHSYAIGQGVGGLTTADTFHFHQGCPISVQHDMIRINPSPSQTWSNPVPYLAYYTTPSPAGTDSLVAIYNDILGAGTGKVVYMCFDLSAMVDSSITRQNANAGRYQLMESVLANVFAVTPLCPHYGDVDDGFVPSATYAYSLEQNRPNPFNPDTDVLYSIGDRSRVSLKVYNVRGQVVRTLVDRVMEAGRHTVHWDGTNDRGELVASGIYFCKMKANEFGATRKMILLK